MSRSRHLGRRQAQTRVCEIAAEVRAAHAARQVEFRSQSLLTALAPVDSYGFVGIAALATLAAKGIQTGFKFLKSKQGKSYIDAIKKSATDNKFKYRKALERAKVSTGDTRKRWLKRAARYKDKLEQAKWSQKLTARGVVGRGPVLEFRRNLLALQWDTANDIRKKEIEQKVMTWDREISRLKQEQSLLETTISGDQVGGLFDKSWTAVDERARQVAPTGSLKPSPEDIARISRATGSQGLAVYGTVNSINGLLSSLELTTVAAPVSWMVIGGVAGAVIAFHLTRLVFERKANTSQVVELAKRLDLQDVVEDPGFILTLLKMTPVKRLDMGNKFERLVNSASSQQHRDKLARRLRMVGAVSIFEAARDHEAAEAAKQLQVARLAPIDSSTVSIGEDRARLSLSLDRVNTKIGRLLTGGVGGQRFVSQAPPGPGRLIRVPFFPETNSESWSGDGGIDRPGDDPILRVQILPGAFATDGPYHMVTRALSYGRYRIVGLQDNFQGSYNSVFEGTQAPAPVAVSLSDLHVYNGQALFLQSDQIPAGAFSVLPTNIVLNTDGVNNDQLFENPASYRRRSSRFFAGLRSNPVIDTDSTVSISVQAFTSATMDDSPAGQIDMPFSAWLVGEMLEDKVFGSIVNPGSYARAGAQVKVGAKDLGRKALQDTQQFIVTSARYRPE